MQTAISQSTSQPCPTPCEGECECKGPAVAPASGKKSVLSYYLAVRGVYGRNRSSKFTLIDVLKDCDPQGDLPSLAEFQAQVQDILTHLKFKSGIAILKEQPEEVEEHTGTGLTSRCYAMFSDRKVLTVQRTTIAKGETADVFTFGGEK